MRRAHTVGECVVREGQQSLLVLILNLQSLDAPPDALQPSPVVYVVVHAPDGDRNY